jgi:hypothetical protein
MDGTQFFSNKAPTHSTTWPNNVNINAY